MGVLWLRRRVEVKAATGAGDFPAKTSWGRSKQRKTIFANDSEFRLAA